MGKRTYILLNAKTIDLEYEDDAKKRVVTIKGLNTCYAARKYGAYSDYKKLTYDVRVCIGGKDLDFSFFNMVTAEGFAVLAAFSTSEAQVYKMSTLPHDTLNGYSINLDASYFLQQIDAKIDF